MSCVPENILKSWIKIKKEFSNKEDFFYIDEFLNKCNPKNFKNNILEFEVTPKIFKDLEKKGLFKKLMFLETKIKLCIPTEYKLENLVIGKFNQAFIDVSNKMLNRNYRFNPIFVHSEPGLGKTYILKKLENSAKKSGILIKYYHTNDFIKNLYALFGGPSKKIEEFKNELYKNEIILFDDIQFLSNKDEISKIFFQIINHENINLVCIADVHPEELININKRLISRFQNGLVLKLDNPDIDSATKIIKFKLKLLNFPIDRISENTIKLIANSFKQDIRKLEGVITKLVFNFSTTKNKIIEPIDLQLLLENYKFVLDKKISIQKIKKIVSNFYGINPKTLLSKQRKKQIIIARYIVMLLMRELRGDIHENIAKAFNAKSHATAVNAIKKLKKMLKIDKNLKEEFKSIKKKCIDF